MRAYIPDIQAAIELLQNAGAHHRYYDEVANAVAELEQLRIENAELRACFSAATVDWSFAAVDDVVTKAKLCRTLHKQKGPP